MNPEELMAYRTEVTRLIRERDQMQARLDKVRALVVNRRIRYNTEAMATVIAEIVQALDGSDQ